MRKVKTQRKRADLHELPCPPQGIGAAIYLLEKELATPEKIERPHLSILTDYDRAEIENALKILKAHLLA